MSGVLTAMGHEVRRPNGGCVVRCSPRDMDRMTRSREVMCTTARSSTLLVDD